MQRLSLRWVRVGGLNRIQIRKSTHPHAVELLTPSVWTCIVTGPVVREWGFWVWDDERNRRSFVPYTEYFWRK